MPSKRPKDPKEGKEVAISVIGIDRREEMLWISGKPALEENFPPCIKNIIQRVRSERGCHRTAAILASFLGQVGWNEAEAKELWQKAAGVEERIFAEWFQKMHCPKCETMKKESKGYPELGVANLDLCRPDEKCSEIKSPVEYAANLKDEADLARGRQKQIKTIYVARVFNWAEGKEGEIELTSAEKDELARLQLELKDDAQLVYTRSKVRGRLRPKFSIRQIEGPRRRMLSEIL